MKRLNSLRPWILAIGLSCVSMCTLLAQQVIDEVVWMVGDEAILFGCVALPLEHMAEVCDTIPYEILTGISSRVQRRYWRE